MILKGQVIGDKEGFVNTIKEGGVATITFFHPAHNSMPGHQLAALSGAIEMASAAKDVAVIVLHLCVRHNADSSVAISTTATSSHAPCNEHRLTHGKV